MSQFDYDLFVVGAGSGGVRAGRLAAASGARVAVAEEYRVGGTCVIRGCVPKKLLVYGAAYRQWLADAPSHGWLPLQAEGLRVGRSRIARIMRESRLFARTKKAFRPAARRSVRSAPNLLRRRFGARSPDRKWVTDVKYVRTTAT